MNRVAEKTDRWELFFGLFFFLVLMFIGYSTYGLQIVAQDVAGPYPGTVSANELDFTMVAGNVSSNTFVCTGKELLIARNSSTDTTYTITITSQLDEYNRSGDITAYEIGPLEYAAFKFTNTRGWRDSSGLVSFTVNNASIYVAILNVE